MRACVFTTDLGTIAAGKGALVRQITDLTGESSVEVCFVGCRQSQALEPGTDAYQPYVDEDHYFRMRVANTLFRLVDAKLAPMAAARAGLSLCAARLVEAILACDPDVVLLDVGWGDRLKPLLERELPGRVFVTGQQPAGWTPPARLDPSKKVSIVLPVYTGSRATSDRP